MAATARELVRACGLAIAVPLTRERFLADHGDRTKEFVRLWAQSYYGFSAERLWAQYRGVAAYGLQVARETEAAGACVVTDATLSSFAALTRSSRVVTLIAHWADERDAAIEYADGIVRLQRVIDVLPTGFDGVIDLTVCTSTRAIAAFKQARPRCTVIANREPASLDVRLAMYRQTVQLMQRGGTSYVEAAQHVRLAALEAL